MSKDWIPKSKEEQLILARTWLSMLPDTEWNVSKAEIAELAALTAAAEEAHRQTVNGSGGKTLNALEREALRALIEFMRVLRRRRFVVAEEVDFSIIPRGNCEVAVDFWQKGAAHKEKPNGYDGAVVVWGVRDGAPEHPQDLAHHTLASQTPHTLQFVECEKGKTAIIALAWHNERGILGQWSEYKTAVVP